VGALRFYSRVLVLAFRHSLERSHITTYAIILLAGAVAYFWPPVHEMIGLNEWQIAALSFGGIIAARLAMAPYWAYQEINALVPSGKPDWERANTELWKVTTYLLWDSGWGKK
jgi:hypothetical protein